MKKVFIFEIKKLLIPLSIFLGIMTIIGLTLISFSDYSNWTFFSLLFGCYMLFLIFGLTYLTFSYNKKRIRADMTYSLPVTKRKLFMGKYLAVLASLGASAIIYMIICILTFVIANSIGAVGDSVLISPFSTQLGHFVLSSLVHIGTSIALLNFIVLFYYKANTVLDGIVFIVLGLTIVYLVTQFIQNLANTYVHILFPLAFYVSAPTRCIDSPFTYLFTGNDKTMFYTAFWIYIIFGYLIFLYFFWFSKKDSSIRTQEICNGIFGYKVFLPLIAILVPLTILTIDSWNDFNLISFICTVIGLFIIYCIYHRSIKFSKQSYISFAIISGVYFIIMLVYLI